MKQLLIWLLAATALAVLSGGAHAQGGNVFGPSVREGDRSWEWRAVFDLDAQGDVGGATRLHYQHAFNEAVRLRGVAQFAADPGEALDAQFFRAEALWQYREAGQGHYQAAIRLDARLSAEGPHRLGLHWAQQWDWQNDWRGRLIVTGEHDAGAGAASGVRLSYRSRLSRPVNTRLDAGIEAFGRVGNLADGLPGFNAQRHTIGPALFGPVNDHWRWHATSQFAVSGAASDMPLRFRLYRRF